jgi:precorrin-6Y C5,15-methyltransferase (decarboxylating)
MSHPVAIIGLGAEGAERLSARALSAIRSATFLAGGRRHLRLAGPTGAETFTITNNLVELIDRLNRRGPDELCVVLSSGDPLYFGIGQWVILSLGGDQVRVEPSVSSIQLAFARVGLCWQDAAIASIHGRPLKPALLPLLGRSKIGLFTRDGDSPSEVARFFLDRGLADDYHAWVCQDLGTEEESVFPAALPDLSGRRFSDLNVLVLVRRPSSPEEEQEPTDDAFARPKSGAVLLTHEDVRALVVRRFRRLVDGPIWDVGAGLGGVSVELARAFPDREVLAVERSAVQVEFLKTNRRRFQAFNVRVVEGEAPECFVGEETPAGIFVGGSGGRLDAILSALDFHLRPGGRFVANFVGLENLASTLERLRNLGWRPELTQVQVSEGRPLAGLTTLVPQRPVWVVAARKP